MKIKLFIAFLFLILTISVSSFFLYNNREQTTEENIKRVENFTENIVKQSQKENVLIWDRENITTEWNYYTGFMMYALLKTTLYNDFVEKYYNDNILPNGNVRFYKKGELDSVLPALNLYYIDKKKYKPTIDYVYKQLLSQPKIAELGNNYAHKTNNNAWVLFPVATDGTFMTFLFLAEHKDFDYVYEKLKWYTEHLKKDNGLYSHGITYHGKQNKITWLRGIGWYAMAQVEVIERFPEGKQKEDLKKNLVPFFDNMLKYRDKKSKMWTNVVNPKNKRLKDNRLETSGSAMMAYSMLKACNNGYISEKYCTYGIETFNGIVNKNLKNNKLKNIYLSSSVKMLEDEYSVNPYVENDAKGIAPLILAALEAKKFNTRHHKIQTQDAR